MRNGSDLTSFNLAISLDRQSRRRFVVNLDACIKGIFDAFPKRLRQQRSLFYWQAQRLGNDLIYAHGVSVSRIQLEENLLLELPALPSRRADCNCCSAPLVVLWIASALRSKLRSGLGDGYW